MHSRFPFSIAIRLERSCAFPIGVFSLFISAELDLNRSPPLSDDSTMVPEAISDVNQVERAQNLQERMNFSTLNIPRKARDSVRKKRTFEKALKKIHSQRSETRRKSILLMKDDEKKVYFQNKREKERKHYQDRKLRRVYGRKSNDYIKQLRQKVKNEQATLQEIARLEKVRHQDRQKYHRKKARLAVLNKKGS